MPRRPPTRARMALALAAAAALAGCASWPAHGVRPTPEGTYRIALPPVAVTARAAHLSDLTTVAPPGPEGAAEDAAVRAVLARVGADTTRALADGLAASPLLEVVPAPPATLPPGADPASAARAAGADAALVVDLSGYGRIKGRWIAYLIGSGAVEALVQGVVAGRVVGNPWVGVGVGLEEMGSELLTWGGGAWLFDAWYAPVTLEAKLVAAADGRTVWRDVVFVGIDRKGLKALPKAERERREVQLAVTAAKARGELVGDLERAARGRLHPQRPAPPGWHRIPLQPPRRAPRRRAPAPTGRPRRARRCGCARRPRGPAGRSCRRRSGPSGPPPGSPAWRPRPPRRARRP
jgi:hypothetical protein